MLCFPPKVIFHAIVIGWVWAADDDFNIVHKDGSFEFGYNNPDSYHFADGNRNNVVRGEFGGRNPKTGKTLLQRQSLIISY